jgi:arylsulfatase A-like enzyme
LLDIYPTLCELIEVPVPDTVEGTSLSPAMREDDEKLRDVLLFAYRGVQRAVQDRQYKLIEYAVDGQRRTQLFDLGADPWELNDLSADPGQAARIASLREQLLRWRDDLGDSQPGQGESFWQRYGD